MTVVEAVHQILGRPECYAVLEPDRVVRVSQHGFLMNGFGTNRDYARLRVQDVLAMTWQIRTRDELVALTAGAPGNGAPGA